MTIKISIIVPNFNHAHYLPTCLDSILAQKVLPEEVILIDDGSKDNSLEIMQSYAKKSPIFTVIANGTNIGVNQSTNNALKLITGTHMLFLAADDWMLPDLLAEAYKMLSKYPEAGFWSSGSWIVYEDNIQKLYPILMNYPIKTAGYIDPKSAKEFLYKYDSWFAGNTTVHNVKHFTAEKGFDPSLRSFADGLLYRVMASKYGCCFTPKRLSVWRIRRDSHSQVCSKEIDTLMTITNVTMKKLGNEYKEIFSDSLSLRTNRRLLFSTAKIIWLQDKRYSKRLDEFIKSNNLGFIPNNVIKLILSFVRIIPGRNLFGQILLLINYKPFDLWYMLRARLNTTLASPN